MKKESKRPQVPNTSEAGNAFQKKSRFNTGRESYFQGDDTYVYTYWNPETNSIKKEVIENITQLPNGREIAVFLDDHDHRFDLDEDEDRRRISCKGEIAESRMDDEPTGMVAIDRTCIGDSLGEKALHRYDPQAMLEQEDEPKNRIATMLYQFMDRLTQEQVELLTQIYWEQKGQREIAAECVKPDGSHPTEQAIHDRKRKALNRLRRMFEEAGITSSKG